MKKLAPFIAIIILFCTVALSFAASLSGGISATDVLNQFYGRWHVTSKVLECDNPKMFNNLSVDIWELSGHQNVLVLTNPNSGATSSISIENKNIDGKTLKFTRTKVDQLGDEKVVYLEMPELTIDGSVFLGFDTYIVERYKNGALTKRSMVKYKIVGQRI